MVKKGWATGFEGFLGPNTSDWQLSNRNPRYTIARIQTGTHTENLLFEFPF